MEFDGLIEYIKCMYWMMVYRTNVFVYVMCRGGDGDALRGLGEDKGCTSKPDSVGRR